MLHCSSCSQLQFRTNNNINNKSLSSQIVRMKYNFNYLGFVEIQIISLAKFRQFAYLQLMERLCQVYWQVAGRLEQILFHLQFVCLDFQQFSLDTFHVTQHVCLDLTRCWCGCTCSGLIILQQLPELDKVLSQNYNLEL